MAAPEKKVSMQAIADKLGISKSAVSIALANKPGVSDDLRASVLETAQGLGYSLRPANGRSSEAGRSGNILVLIPEYISGDTFFYNEIYWSIEKEAKTRGYTAILTSVSKESEALRTLPSIMSDLPFCGIIIVGIFEVPYVEKLSTLGLPLLSVDHSYGGLPLDAVVTENIEGAYEVVRYLIERGHRKIGYIGSIQMTASLFERWCGYQKALLEAGLAPDPEHSILQSTPLSDLLGNVDEISQYLDRMQDFPTAWFCGGDRIAVALIHALFRRKLRVPEDISVAGFDDLQAAQMIVPSLTTFRVRRSAMGILAVDTLLDRLRLSGEKLKISIYGEFVERNSVAAPRSL